MKDREMTLADTLRPYVEKIKMDCAHGCAIAKHVIDTYHLHVSCPGDPAAPALCQAAFDEWRRKT